MPAPSVKVATVERIERKLASAKQEAAAALRARREELGLSLRQVGAHVGLSAAGLFHLETGATWNTETARRVAEFYRPTMRRDAAA